MLTPVWFTNFGSRVNQRLPFSSKPRAVLLWTNALFYVYYTTKEIECYRILICSEPTGAEIKNYKIPLRLQNTGDQTKTEEKSFTGNKCASGTSVNRLNDVYIKCN